MNKVIKRKKEKGKRKKSKTAKQEKRQTNQNGPYPTRKANSKNTITELSCRQITIQKNLILGSKIYLAM